MGAAQHDQTPGLAVEVAKLRLRVAAERAEPVRLLRQQVGSAPLGSAAVAMLAGMALGRGARGAGAAPSQLNRGVNLGASAAPILGTVLADLLTSLVAGAASEWRDR